LRACGNGCHGSRRARHCRSVTELLVADGVLVPTAFAAVTVKVYVVPLAKPVTVIGLPVEVALNVFVLSIAV